MVSKLKIFVLALFAVFFVKCKSTATAAEVNELKKIISNNNFTFIADTAMPMPIGNVQGIENLLPAGSSLANINLTGNPNFLIIKNDSIHLDMPYFGERRMGGGYNSDNGLNFEGKFKDVEIDYNDKKKNYRLKYVVTSNQEMLTLTLTMFVNNYGSLNIISSQRNSINYRGNWKENE